MTYQKEIKEWLRDYKISHFKGLEDGIWKKNKESYPHILPEKHKHDNILSTYKDSFWKSIHSSIKLHPDFHHLNSSQAMCINFFYPLFKEKKLDIILKALKIENDSVDYNSVQFEKDSDVEKQSRPTSFDFYFRTMNGKKIHFEIKFTEQEFGRAKPDTEHINKYELIYKNNCSVINSDYCNCDSFLKNYQLMRNLIHLSDNSYVVFIYPVNNKRVKKQAEFARLNFVKFDLQKNAINLTWEQLVDFVDVNIADSSDLVFQMSEFKDKHKIKPSKQ